MYCENCGKQLEENEVRCSQCGYMLGGGEVKEVTGSDTQDKKKPVSGNNTVSICCGMLIFIVIIIAILNNREFVALNGAGIIWGLAFLVLAIGILHEGIKIIRH
jgi:uncharacterized membrane protein YvbJ